MVSPRIAYEAIIELGYEFFTGVPDSLLKDFCAYVSDNSLPRQHIIAANEGNAIGLAVGHFLATGSPGLVYMQNSGIGNAINPLISIADIEVCRIPMLIMIGWRGEPGTVDEPQHLKQGRVLTKLLDSIEIPWLSVNAGSNFVGVLSEANELLRARNAPVALLVSKSTFQEYKLTKDISSDFTLSREDAIRRIVDSVGESTLIVSTTGMASRELNEYRVQLGKGSGNDFYTVGAMGHASSIALGLERSQVRKRVLCIDGDGALIMHLGSMAIIGQTSEEFIHIVLNNGAHDSVGGQPTVGLDIDLLQIAQAVGYRTVKSVTTEGEVIEFLSGIPHYESPIFLEIKVRPGARGDLGRPNVTPLENRNNFASKV
jgi:phosphonopyruvate decarboxylase